MKVSTASFSILLFIFLGLCSNACLAQTAEANGKNLNRAQQIDQIFAEYNDSNTPGASIAVIQNGKIVFKKGYGSANLEYGIPNTPATVFHIASISKQFTVFSILLLEKEGKLSFDDDIRKYIPEVPDFGELITLRHLASHTSGMRDQWDLLNLAGWRWDDVITKEHIMKIVAKQKELNFKPGEQYNYCNSGFTLLAEVVARISGKSFAEFTEERIFKPLNMSSTLFYDDHEKIVKNRAYSYYQNDGEYKKSVLNFANVGATSLFTTVEDISLWAMNFSNLKVGDAAIIKKMNTLATLNNGETFGGAYGQFVNKHKGLNQIQHGGADAGYRSYLSRFPEQNFAVAVFSNYGPANPVALSLQVADLYLQDFIEEQEETAEQEETMALITLSNEQLSKVTGHFWNEEGSYAREIALRDDTLRYVRGQGNESLLVPVATNEFQMLNVGVDLRVKFEDMASEPVMIVIIDGGEPIISTAFTPPNYTANTLAQFVGKYYSEELSTFYTIVQDGEQLRVTHPRISDREIGPMLEDKFTGEMGRMDFKRNSQQKIIGFRISSGRIQNLKFDKVD